MRDAFSQWFKESFGDRPSNMSLYELENEIQLQISKLKAAREMYKKVDEWETRYLAALKGYSIYKHLNKK